MPVQVIDSDREVVVGVEQPGVGRDDAVPVRVGVVSGRDGELVLPADQRMLEALEREDLASMKVRERVALAVRRRLELYVADREAVRRALAMLALPHNSVLALRLLYRTVDAIWYAAGDTATDFNFYTKRALLAGVYAATVLAWLDDRSPGLEETWRFLDRRINDAMRLPQMAQRFATPLRWLPNPVYLFRQARQDGRRRSPRGRPPG